MVEHGPFKPVVVGSIPTAPIRRNRMEITGVCTGCGKVTGSQNGQHFANDGPKCDGCHDKKKEKTDV